MIAELLSFMTSVKYLDEKIGLPQGAPHSTPLFNRILFPLDNVLSEKATARGMTYTRWNDDFIISSKEIIPIEKFLGATKIVEKEFPLSPNKTYFQQSPKDIYLLGHIIRGNTIIKNSREDALKNKGKPLDTKDYSGKYELWL